MAEDNYRPIVINSLKKVAGSDKKIVVPHAINCNQIHYYRPWTDPEGIKTVIYFKDTTHGLVLECGFDHLKHVLSKSKLVDRMNLESLTFDQLKKIEKMVSEMKEQTEARLGID